MRLHGLDVLLAPGDAAREMARGAGNEVARSAGDQLGKGFEALAVIAVGIIVLLGLVVVWIVVAIVRAHRRGRTGTVEASRPPGGP